MLEDQKEIDKQWKLIEEEGLQTKSLKPEDLQVIVKSELDEKSAEIIPLTQEI